MAIVLLRVQQRELVAVVHGKQIAMLLRELDRLVGQAHELRAVLVPLGLVPERQLVRVVADRLELLGVELQLVHDGVELAGVRIGLRVSRMSSRASSFSKRALIVVQTW